MECITVYEQHFYTVGSKIIRALAVILAIFLRFDCHFLSSHGFYKQYKAYRSLFDKYLFHKAALGTSFLTRINSSARKIFLPTVIAFFEYILCVAEAKVNRVTLASYNNFQSTLEVK